MAGVLLGCARCAHAQTLATKSIAAPPSDILSGVVRRPDASTTGVSSFAASYPIELRRGGDGVWRASVEFFVSDPATARLMVVSPDADEWTSRLRFSDGQTVALNDVGQTDGRVKRHRGNYGIPGVPDAATMFEVQGESTGAWTLEIAAPAVRQNNGRDKYESKVTHGYLLVTSDDPIALYAWAEGGVVGEPIEFYASLYDTSIDGLHRVGEAMPTPMHVKNFNPLSDFAVQSTRSMLRDDPWRGDVARQSGTLTVDEPGLNKMLVFLEAELPDGRVIQRTATLLIPVVDAHAAIESVSTSARGDIVEFEFALSDARLPVGEHFFAGAEVWGTSPRGPAPVAWIGGMVTPEFDNERPDRATFTLEMHADWLALAAGGEAPGVGGPYWLENVRLADPDFHVEFAGRDAMTVDLPASVAQRGAQAITPAMLTGRMNAARSVRLADTGSGDAAAGGIELDFSAHNLMLVHGYCSGAVPWPIGQFSPPLSVFGDFNQSRSNDEFAQLLGTLGTLSKSFGVVAHSQGGLAALHLYTFYWSGLDWARGPRLIQSVGSPYQGTALAGELAALGAIFGTGCGENYDLTYAGAAAWLSTIPTWARQRVYFHTTSFLDEPFTFDYCNLVSDFFLSDPEDGVVERVNAQLPGANNMGHKEGWCHTTGMQDPAQYQDTARNADMNTSAAR